MTPAMMPEAADAGPGIDVFVYGTLRAGGSNDINRLRPAPRCLGPAQVWGRLFDLGPYPGLRLLAEGEALARPVWGEVYRVAPELEAVLDAIEDISGRPDDEYQRRQITVMLGAHALTCLVYEIHPDRVHGRPEIGHGDWMRHVLGR